MALCHTGDLVMKSRSIAKSMANIDYWEQIIRAAKSAAEPYRTGEALSKHDAQLSTLNQLAYCHASSAVESLGLFPDVVPIGIGELYDTGKVVADQRNAFARLLDLCVASGVLKQDASGKFLRVQPWLRPLSEAQIFSLQSGMDDAKPLFDFVNEFGRAVPEILSGKRHAAELLFRGGRLDTALRLYEETPPFKYCNTVAGRVMAELARLVSQQGRMHVVEIGAGTGATTKAILPSAGSAISRYLFTDISQFFLVAAQATFKPFLFLDCAFLNIEEPPPQELSGVFDIVVAAHVLHATRNIEETLRHVHTLLADGGLLILLEETAMQPFFAVTMGMQTGFDRFSDAPLRTRHPLLTSTQWQEAAARRGFARSEVFPDVMGICPILIGK